MKSNLVYDVNPLVISRIEAYKGARRGKHPIFHKLIRRKHPIASALGCLRNNDRRHMFDGWIFPEVVIYGTSGEEIRTIRCKSNSNAINLRDDLIDQLDDFLDKIVVDIRSESV